MIRVPQIVRSVAHGDGWRGVSGTTIHFAIILLALMILSLRADVIGQRDGSLVLGINQVEDWSLPARIVVPAMLAVISTAIGPWFPVWPLIAFIAIGYGFARDETFGGFCRWGILESLSVLCLTSALANRVDRRSTNACSESSSSVGSQDFFAGSIHRAGALWMTALVVWTMLTSVIAWFGKEYTPAANHHPIQMIDNWCLFVAASWSIRKPAAWWCIAIALAATLGWRISVNPERLYRNGDLGVLLAIAAAYGWTSASSVFSALCEERNALKRLAFGTFTAISVSVCISSALLLLQSQNRGGAVAMVLAALVFFVVLVVNRRWITCISLCVMVSLGLATVIPDSDLLERFERILVTDSGDRGSVDSRFRIYRAGVLMAMDCPIFGVGLGNFEPTMGRYDPDGKSDSSHNNVIGMFAETGLIGGLIYTGLFAIPCFFLLRSANRSATPWQGVAIASTSSILVAYMAGGMFMTRHTFWLAYLTLGAAFATHDQICISIGSKKERKRVGTLRDVN